MHIRLLLTLGVAFASCGGDPAKEDVPNQVPVAAIVEPAADLSIETGDVVDFTATCVDPDGDVLTLRWDFAGAAPDADGATHAVTFADVGSYAIVLTCTDADGAVATAGRTITVTTPPPINEAPVADIVAPAADVVIETGASVRFEGACADPEGGATTHLWSFGGAAPDATSATAEVVFTTAGVYDVSYTCSDVEGLAAPSPVTRRVEVVDPPPVNTAPVATITEPLAPVAIIVGDVVAFVGECVDAEGDALTHRWTFDGVAPDSTLVVPEAVVFDALGTFTVTYRCTDAVGLASAPVALVVTVSPPPNAAPVGTITSPSGDVEIFPGETATFAATCVDPDGDAVQHLWRFDGAAGDRMISSPGQVRFADVGSYEVTYTCTDAKGLAGVPASVTVVVVERPNEPPVGIISAPLDDVEIYAGDAVAFEGRCIDADGASVTHAWDFGGLGASDEASVVFTFEVAGSYRVTYGCSDDDGALAEVDVRDVTVLAVGPPVHAVSGVATFDRVHGVADGLDFDAPALRPIRGAEVWIIDATTEDVVADTVTDADGAFAASWPEDGPDFVKVWILSRTATPVIAVADNTNRGSIYALESSVIDTSRSRVVSVHAPSGWDGSRYTSRSAAPYAVLDAAYEAAIRVLAVRPALVMPELTVNWSENNAPTERLPDETQEAAYAAGRIGSSHSNGQALYILGLEDVNTDEYDDHIIVHEWAHYFDARVVGRGDTPGGNHGSGDTKDPRLAFSEGWATALAAMVWWPDTRYCDTYGEGQGVAYRYDVQENALDSNPGWFSERSVMVFLLDVFDDGGRFENFDAVTLGLGAIVDVMVDDMRVTPAFMTLFAFIDALKRAHPNAAAAIDTLGAHRGVLGAPVADAFGTGETNDAGDPDNLPVYRSIDTEPATTSLVYSEVFNDLGQARFFRFVGDGSEVRVRLDNESTQDTDLWVYRDGVLVIDARTFEPNERTAPFVAEAGVDYVVIVRGDPLTASCSITVALERAP